MESNTLRKNTQIKYCETQWFFLFVYIIQLENKFSQQKDHNMILAQLLIGV